MVLVAEIQDIEENTGERSLTKVKGISYLQSLVCGPGYQMKLNNLGRENPLLSGTFLLCRQKMNSRLMT